MYLGAKEIKECPHKTVSRFYNSAVISGPEWRCDWCGQEFSPAHVASKTVEINEASPSSNQSAKRAAVSGSTHGSDFDSQPGDDGTSQVDALPDRVPAPNKRMRRV